MCCPGRVTKEQYYGNVFIDQANELIKKGFGSFSNLSIIHFFDQLGSLSALIQDIPDMEEEDQIPLLIVAPHSVVSVYKQMELLGVKGQENISDLFPNRPNVGNYSRLYLAWGRRNDVAEKCSAGMRLEEVLALFRSYSKKLPDDCGMRFCYGSLCLQINQGSPSIKKCTFEAKSERCLKHCLHPTLRGVLELRDDQVFH